MFKRYSIVIALLVLCFAPMTAMADQFFVDLGLSVTPGQPEYENNRFPIILGYENAKETNLWRFSYANVDFKHKTQTSYLIQSQIISAERFWVYKIKEGFSLIGAFGPGLFMTTADPVGSGNAFGLVATGTMRFSLTGKFFLEGALHYKNCAVAVSNSLVVDGGYQGLVIGGGYFF